MKFLIPSKVISIEGINMTLKPFDYKTRKRRKQGREGVAFLERVTKRILEHCERIPASNPMGYIPHWEDDNDRLALSLVADLKHKVRDREQYATSAGTFFY